MKGKMVMVVSTTTNSTSSTTSIYLVDSISQSVYYVVYADAEDACAGVYTTLLSQKTCHTTTTTIDLFSISSITMD